MSKKQKAPETVKISGASDLAKAVEGISFQLSGPGVEYPWDRAWYQIESVDGDMITLRLDLSKKRQDDLNWGR